MGDFSRLIFMDSGSGPYIGHYPPLQKVSQKLDQAPKSRGTAVQDKQDDATATDLPGPARVPVRILEADSTLNAQSGTHRVSS